MASLTKIGGYGSTASGTSTIPVDLTADINVGDAAWAIFDCSGGRVFNSVTDSQGQTWDIDATVSNGTLANLCIASLASSAYHLVAGVDTVTANLDGSTARRMGVLAKLSSGGPHSGLDQTATNTGQDPTGATVGPTSTLAQADEIALVGVGFSSGSSGDSMNADAGYTLLDNETADLSTNHKYLGVEWLETASTSGVSAAPTWTTTTNPWYSAAIATYKLPAASSSYDQPVAKITSDEAVRGLDLVSGRLVDTYQRTVTDDIGTSDSGHTAVNDQGTATDYAVTPGALEITMPAGQAPIWHYPVDVRHFDLTFDYSFDTAPVGSTQSIGPAWWVADALNYYRLVITQTTGGNTNLLVEQQNNNVDVTIPMDWGSGLQSTTKALLTAQVAGTTYRCRVKSYDDAGTTKFLVKVWLASDAEPSDTPGRSGTNIVGLGPDIAGAYQTHGGLGGRGQTLAANTNTPTYSISRLHADSLDVSSAYDLPIGLIPTSETLRGVSLALSTTLPIGAIPTTAAVRGLALDRTVLLSLAAIPSPSTLRGVHAALTSDLPVGHITSSGQLRGTSLVRATRLTLGYIPTSAAVRGVAATIQPRTPRPISRIVSCYNGSATVSLFLPYDVEVEL